MKTALSIFCIALLILGGCLRPTPFSDVRGDAIRQRAELAMLINARHTRELTCEQFEDLARQLQLSWKVDSIMENTYWEDVR